MKQALLALDDWLFLPIAYLSIIDDPGVCKQLVLSGSVPAELHWAEAETLRFAGRLLRPFTPAELARHLNITENRTRAALRSLVEKRMLEVASGNQRYRTYVLAKMK